jgi:Ca-activated chloride channel family protein
MSSRALLSVFALPVFLTLTAVVAGALALLSAFSARRAAARRRALLAPALAAKTGAIAPGPARGVTLALLLLAALGLGLALARPRWGAKAETAEREGSDVVILLDTSASMRAADITPSRFVLAREAASSLLSRLNGDRFALVAVEGEAQTLVPLTLDASAVGLFLDALEPGVGSRPGTSLASGLAAAIELFPGGLTSGRSCVLVSDGEDLEGGVDDAVAKAKAEGIRIHTVLVGAPSGKGAPVPDVDVAGRVTGYKTDESGSPVLSKPNAAVMRKIAAQTGGTFSVVSPGRTDLDGVAKAIDSAARRPLSGVLLSNLEERFQIPLGVAVGATALLLLGAGSLRLRRAATAAGALLLAAALGDPARAQAPPPQAVPAKAPEPAPAPKPQDLASRLASKPPFATARREAQKGKQALESKDAPGAVEHFAKEVELAPKDPTGAYNLGTALSRAGRPDEAIASLEKARTGGRREVAADAAYNAGETLYEKKDYEGAARAFRESLRLAPNNADAAWNYELCVRKDEEQKKQQQQQKQQQKPQPQKGGKPTPSPNPSPSPDKNAQKPEDQKKKEEEDKEFEKKANMPREKAEQLLNAISQSDLEEQKKRMAEQRSRRRVTRDW